MEFINFNNNVLSRLCLGTVQFGMTYGISNKDGQPSYDTTTEIINYLVDSGINCFDTAKGYGNAEETIGKVLQNYKEKFFISKVNTENFNDKDIRESLAKLKITNLFGLLLHDSKILKMWDISHKEIVQQLKKEKVINYFGASIYTEEEFDLALENSEIDIIQIPFNIFDLRAIKYDWFKKAKLKNKLLFIRSIFLQGLLFMDKEKLPINLKDAGKYLLKLEEICNKHNLSKEQLLIDYVNHWGKDSILLFGCENMNQAKNNINLFANTDKLEINLLDEIYKEFNSVPEIVYNPTKW